jgi:hypothetical protein
VIDNFDQGGKMSADNGIYIAKFPDGYRVTHMQAVDNLDYFGEGTTERKHELRAHFGGSPLFSVRNEAILYAHDLAQNIVKDFGILEYGVCEIGEYESFE